jgi:CCR4-NOT transcription complex subunit 1
LLPSLGQPESGTADKEHVTYPQDVEEEANFFYEKIYSSQLSVESVIDMLIKYKVSTVPREQQVYACMLQSLFDEYQFFHRYPDKELAITSSLFGKVIQEDVIATNAALGTALRYVLEALRSPKDNKLFQFGLQALLQFKDRVKEWPHYCNHLYQINAIKEAAPELHGYLQDVIAKLGTGPNEEGESQVEREPQENPAAQSVNTSQNSEKLPTLTSMNIDTLLNENINFEVPPEATQDKIGFIMNNLSESNYESKVPTLKSQLKAVYLRWFANYIVVKRVSIEPNYHSLYRQVLEKLAIAELQRHVIEQTLRTTALLLNSEKALTQASERSLLKNLGSWLGGLTLAMNKPIRHKDLAVKVCFQILLFFCLRKPTIFSVRTSC